jgi:oligo-1,6-glucosidase
MAYAFEGVDLAKPEGYSVLKLKEIFSRWDSAFAREGWLSVFLANHDQARMVSRFGNDAPAFREASSKLLSTFILTMRGTPYCYFGDELGMTNADFKDVSEFRDVQTLNEFAFVKRNGGDLNALLKRMQASSRDNGRTPMHWTKGNNAGFTSGKPWIKLAPNYTQINVSEQELNPNSCLQYFRKLTALRRANPEILVYGRYVDVDRANPGIYAYYRIGTNGKMLVVLNFSAERSTLDIPEGLGGSTLSLNNLKDPPSISGNGTQIKLYPYQALIYKFKE